MRAAYCGTRLVCSAIALLGMVNAPAMVFAEQSFETPADLVRRTVQNEVAASNDNTKVMFMDRKQTPRGSQTKLMVETRDGMAGLVVAINDKPLNPEQRQAEEARLAGL